jgi:hypothetical protein
MIHLMPIPIAGYLVSCLTEFVLRMPMPPLMTIAHSLLCLHGLQLHGVSLRNADEAPDVHPFLYLGSSLTELVFRMPMTFMKPIPSHIWSPTWRMPIPFYAWSLTSQSWS